MYAAARKMRDWGSRLKFDPLPSLLASKSEALRYFTCRDLLNEETGSVQGLWQMPAVRKIVGAQLESGAWKYHGGRRHIRSSEDYDQLETYRMLRELVEKYGLNKEHPAIRKAAEFLFSHQTEEGDFRGICGNQYVPYYSGAIMELLIKSGYVKEPRIERGFQWLISVRQDDWGWAFPLRTVGMKLDAATFQSDTVQPDKSKPFSHLITGMALRAFAAHPDYRLSSEAYTAGNLLASRFFKSDKYPDRQAPSFWTSFSYPFWFTDLLSSLDTLSRLGFASQDRQIKRALEWFITRQQVSGLWRLPLRIMAREEEPHSWITLAFCRTLSRFAAEK